MTGYSVDPENQIIRLRVNADLNRAFTQLINAQSATDRLCLNNSFQSIVVHCDRQKVAQAILAASSLYEFYSKLGVHLERVEAPAGH